MISFYPGPSRVHDEVPLYVKDSYKDGILSINHRSDEFMSMSKKTIELLRQKLNIPREYIVFFTSSATECWEIIAQSMVQNKSYHLYNGAFGQKWWEYTKRLLPAAEGVKFSLNERLDPEKLNITEDHAVLCITQNETSNGTQVANSIIRSLKKHHPTALIAVDATSSMAGITLDFKAADIWFASVQKCFGLPAGLGLLICSPQALEVAKKIGERNHYNSITFMSEMMDKWQTPFTPNVLAIYLLMRVLEKSPPIKEIHKKVLDRYDDWILFLSERKHIKHLIETQGVQSYTVITVTATIEVVQAIKTAAKNDGILLGEGYGEWKLTTFRIANFPALRKKEIKQLMQLLKKF